MAEYTSSVDICNKALQELGCARITTLLDNSRNAAECNFLYDKARVALLREYVWGFSIAYFTLTAGSPTTQAFQSGDTRNRFNLPPGFMRLADQNPRTAGRLTQATTGGVKSTDYSIEGSFLLTANASVLLRYANDVTNVTLMDPLFCDALAARMCVDGLAETLTQNVQKRQLAELRYEKRIALAKLIQVIEAASDEPIEEALKTAKMLEMPPQPQPAQQQGRQR